MTNFDELIDLKIAKIETTFLGKQLVLNNLVQYNGPITMQYLPYGGVQSTFAGFIIINTKNGFLASNEVIYDGQKMLSNVFVQKYPFIVNQVLPN